jgi:ectoine hydroxylase-related dioxygenase (phytanoyl-CoA dioxygenase family)
MTSPHNFFDASRFADNGFAVYEQLFPEEMVAAAALEAEQLFAQFPEDSGSELTVYGDRNRCLESMSRIDHPQLASPAIAALIRHQKFGEVATALMGGNAVQAWYIHMSRKPAVSEARTHIGWHQDGQYSSFMEGSFVTAWIPLSIVDKEDSPLCYVTGSHKLGIIGGSGFSGEVSLDTLKERLMARCAIHWSEVEICASPGTVVMHDSLIIHGSRNNLANRPRLALTVHMRSNLNYIHTAPESRVTLSKLKDPHAAPILYGNASNFTDF